MKLICRDIPILHKFARESDRLGWRNFVEAKVSNELFVIQEAWLRSIHSRQSIETWTRGFLTKLLNITHQQWLYRNARIHIRHVEGLSMEEHNRIMEKVKSLIGTDPMSLLPEHRELLRVDYEELGSGSTVDRQYWIASVESALKAKRRLQDEHSGGYHPKRRRTKT